MPGAWVPSDWGVMPWAPALTCWSQNMPVIMGDPKVLEAEQSHLVSNLFVRSTAFVRCCIECCRHNRTAVHPGSPGSNYMHLSAPLAGLSHISLLCALYIADALQLLSACLHSIISARILLRAGHLRITTALLCSWVVPTDVASHTQTGVFLRLSALQAMRLSRSQTHAFPAHQLCKPL